MKMALGNIFFPLIIVVPFKTCFFFKVKTDYTVQKLVYLCRYLSNICTKDVGPEIETVFRGLICWRGFVYNANSTK